MQNLSTKEVNYLKDILSWELLSAKKSYQYSNQETNPEKKKIFFDNTQVHQQNYLNILNYVNKVNTQQGGQTH